MASKPLKQRSATRAQHTRMTFLLSLLSPPAAILVTGTENFLA